MTLCLLPGIPILTFFNRSEHPNTLQDVGVLDSDVNKQGREVHLKQDNGSNQDSDVNTMATTCIHE